MIVDLAVYAGCKMLFWIGTIMEGARLPFDWVMGSYDWAAGLEGLGAAGAPWLVFVPVDWLRTFALQWAGAWIAITLLGFVYHIVMRVIQAALDVIP